MKMTTVERPALITDSGEVLYIMPGTENPLPIDEVIRLRDEFYEKNKHLLKDYSVEQFLREKHREVEMELL